MVQAVLALASVVLPPVAAVAGRVPGSPYPIPGAGLNASHELHLVDVSTLSHDMVLGATSLQGVVGRTAPALILYDGKAAVPATLRWARHLGALWGVTLNSTLAADFPALLRAYRPHIDGYVLCDTGNASTNAAISIAAADSRRLVVTAPSAGHYFEAAGIPRAVDARTLEPGDVLTNQRWGPVLSHRITTVQHESKAAFVSDYSVFSRALQWWDTAYDTGVAAKVYAALRANAATFGWGSSEFGLVRAASAAAGFVHASDFAQNLATLSSYALLALSQRRAAAPDGPDPPVAAAPVHTVAFVMTDGDNLQWLLSDTGFSTSGRWYNSTQRGRVPLGWTMAPAMAELAPAALHSLYQGASTGPRVCSLTAGQPQSTAAAAAAAAGPCGPDGGADEFVAAPSGIGYNYPDDVPAGAALGRRPHRGHGGQSRPARPQRARGPPHRRWQRWCGVR